MWDLGEMMKPVRSQFDGRDRNRKWFKKLPWVLWGFQGGGALPAGHGKSGKASWRKLTAACSSDYLSLGLHFSRKKKKKSSFPKLALFQFTDSLVFNKMVKGKGSCPPLSYCPGWKLIKQQLTAQLTPAPSVDYLSGNPSCSLLDKWILQPEEFSSQL